MLKNFLMVNTTQYLLAIIAKCYCVAHCAGEMVYVNVVNGIHHGDMTYDSNNARHKETLNKVSCLMELITIFLCITYTFISFFIRVRCLFINIEIMFIITSTFFHKS